MGAGVGGWWRDRPAAVRKLVDRLRCYGSATGVTVEVVFDVPQPDLPEGVHDGIVVRYATRRGRDAGDDRIRALLDEGYGDDDVEVITSDRALATSARERVHVPAVPVRSSPGSPTPVADRSRGRRSCAFCPHAVNCADHQRARWRRARPKTVFSVHSDDDRHPGGRAASAAGTARRLADRHAGAAAGFGAPHLVDRHGLARRLRHAAPPRRARA